MTSKSLHTAISSPTLESVRVHLTQWRNTRSKGSRIPKSLWQDIKSLTTAQNYVGIASVLNISPQRLRKEADFMPSEKSPEPKAPFPFVEVPHIGFAEDPFEQRKEPPPQGTGVIEMTRANGTHVTVSGLDQGMLISLLQQL